MPWLRRYGITVAIAGGFTFPPVRPQLEVIGQETSREDGKVPGLWCGPSIIYHLAHPSLLLTVNRKHDILVPKLSALLRCKMTINWARLFDHARAIVQTHIRPPSTCPFCLPSDSFAQSLLHQGLTPSFVHVAYASCLLEIH